MTTKTTQENARIPTSHEVGLVGPAAHIYDAQVLLVNGIGHPEYYADISMQVISFAEFALAEASPVERRGIQVRCQQTLSHHAFIARVLLDLMHEENRNKTAEAVLRFTASLQNDVLVSIASSGADSAENIAKGNVLAAKQAAPLAIAAALRAAANRFSVSGSDSIFALFKGLFRSGEVKEQRRRWLLGIETLLEGAAARAEIFGPAHAIADIGRRCMPEILALHRDEWEGQRAHMRYPAFAGGFFLIILAILVGKVAVLIAIIVGIIWAYKHFTVDAGAIPPPIDDPSAVSMWWFAAGAVVVIPLGWALFVEFRKWAVSYAVRRRLQRWIHTIESGKLP